MVINAYNPGAWEESLGCEILTKKTKLMFYLACSATRNCHGRLGGKLLRKQLSLAKIPKFKTAF